MEPRGALASAAAAAAAAAAVVATAAVKPLFSAPLLFATAVVTVVVGFVGKVNVHIFVLVGGRHVTKKTLVDSTILDSSSNGNFAILWKKSCTMRATHTSNSNCLVML